MYLGQIIRVSEYRAMSFCGQMKDAPALPVPNIALLPILPNPPTLMPPTPSLTHAPNHSNVIYHPSLPIPPPPRA